MPLVGDNICLPTQPSHNEHVGGVAELPAQAANPSNLTTDLSTRSSLQQH